MVHRFHRRKWYLWGLAAIDNEDPRLASFQRRFIDSPLPYFEEEEEGRRAGWAEPHFSLPTGRK
jgi:hypothetical protein